MVLLFKDFKLTYSSSQANTVRKIQWMIVGIKKACPNTPQKEHYSKINQNNKIL